MYQTKPTLHTFYRWKFPAASRGFHATATAPRSYIQGDRERSTLNKIHCFEVHVRKPVVISISYASGHRLTYELECPY